MNLRDRMKARVANRGGAWYEIRAAADAAVVRIYDEIGYWGVTADQFVRELSALDVDAIEVQINSPGGDVFDGLAIYNALRTHRAHVTTRVDGLAASAASVVAQAGDHRVIVQSAQIMIHEAWGVAIGPADELREFADLLDTQNDVLASIYAERSGGDAAAFREMMAAETWLVDEAAVEAGLADEVLVPARKDAPASALADTPPALATTPAPTPAPPAPAPVAAFDATDHLDREWVREMLGSTALAD